MMTRARTAAVIALALMLAACGGFELQHMVGVKSVDNPYYSTLYSGYLTRAEHEQRYGHYVSADSYAIKARKAAGGEGVAVFTPNDADVFPDGAVPAADVDAMMDVRLLDRRTVLHRRFQRGQPTGSRCLLPPRL
jgi:hypothetical protein